MTGFMKERCHALETIPAGASALLDHQTGELTLDSDHPVGPPEDWSRQELVEAYKQLDGAAQELLDSIPDSYFKSHPDSAVTLKLGSVKALRDARGLRRPRP